MGWTVTCGPLRGVTPDQFLRNESEYERDGRSVRIIASAFVGSTWYAAARVGGYEHDGKVYPPYVTAYVCLTSKRRDGFGYKDMSEAMGPNECRCPARILALLSPVEELPYTSYVADWRKRCVEALQTQRTTRGKVAALTPGTRLRMPEPVRFRSGAEVQTFRVVPTPGGRRGVALAADDGRGGLYRLPAAMLATAEVLDA